MLLLLRDPFQFPLTFPQMAFFVFLLLFFFFYKNKNIWCSRKKSFQNRLSQLSSLTIIRYTENSVGGPHPHEQTTLCHSKNVNKQTNKKTQVHTISKKRKRLLKEHWFPIRVSHTFSNRREWFFVLNWNPQHPKKYQKSLVMTFESLLMLPIWDALAFGRVNFCARHGGFSRACLLTRQCAQRASKPAWIRPDARRAHAPAWPRL